MGKVAGLLMVTRSLKRFGVQEVTGSNPVAPT